MRTITWDVDPADWSMPGSGAIYSRIVGAAQPGSIILMHDGGGPRSETLAALPRDHRRPARPRLPLRHRLPAARRPDIYRPYG